MGIGSCLDFGRGRDTPDGLRVLAATLRHAEKLCVHGEPPRLNFPHVLISHILANNQITRGQTGKKPYALSTKPTQP